MKNMIQSRMKSWTLLLLACLLQVSAWAQDAKLDVNITKQSSSNWYASPWVWIVGGAVFILLLVALLRGGRHAD